MHVGYTIPLTNSVSRIPLISTVVEFLTLGHKDSGTKAKKQFWNKNLR